MRELSCCCYFIALHLKLIFTVVCCWKLLFFEGRCFTTYLEDKEEGEFVEESLGFEC